MAACPLLLCFAAAIAVQHFGGLEALHGRAQILSWRLRADTFSDYRVVVVDECVGICIVSANTRCGIATGEDAIVSRDGKYIASIRVRNVYDNFSSAQILYGSHGVIQTDDKVTFKKSLPEYQSQP